MIRIDEDLVISFFNEISEITDQYIGEISSSSMIERLRADLNYIIAKCQSQDKVFNYLSVKVNTKTVSDEYTDAMIVFSVTPGQIFSKDIYEFFNNHLQAHELLIKLQ